MSDDPAMPDRPSPPTEAVAGTRARRGRPTDEEKTRAIVAGARKLFFERGVESVSMDQIAAQAGVARTTVYAKFGSRDAVFDAVVETIAAPVEDGFDADVAADESVEQTLTRYGMRLMSALAQRRLLGAEPVIMLEAARNPGLGRRCFDAGPGRVRSLLAEAIAAWDERGLLRVDDPVRAAEDLIGLWQGVLPFELRLKPSMKLGERRLRTHVARGVANFLKLYGV